MKDKIKTILNRKTTIILLLCLLSVGHAVSNIMYINKSSTRPVMEEFNFIQRVNSTYDIFVDDASLLDKFKRISKLQYSTQYPIYPLSAASLALILGNQDPFYLLRIIQILYLFIFIVFLYKLGELLFNRTTGVLSVIVCTFAYFNFNSLSRLALVDLPMTAMVTLTIYLLLKSDNFKDRKYTLLFGIFSALTLMTKFQAIGILFAPVLMVCLNLAFPNLQPGSVSQGSKQTKRGIPWKNIILALVIFLGIYLLFMLYDLNTFRHWLRKEVLDTAYSVGPQGRFNWDATVYYFTDGIYDYLTIFFLLPFLIGLFWALLKERKRAAILNFWFWGGYLFFTYVVGDKEPRYAVPFLPAVAIISVFWITLLKRDFLRRCLIALLVVLSIFFYLGSVWEEGPLRKDHFTIEI